jgi:peptide deformylase
MSKHEILTYPDKFLKEPTQAVENIDAAVQKLIEDMAETMYAAPGIGLAAIQIGSDKRLFVYDESPGESKQHYQVIINPKIIESQGLIVSENEGCLSVPDFRSDVKRAAKILVEGVDRNGKPVRKEAEGFLAVVFQHEIDHLDGTLFIDRISPLKRELYRRRMRKLLRKNE